MEDAEQGDQEYIYQTRAYFDHLDQVIECLNVLVKSDQDEDAHKKAFLCVRDVLDLYQEQPHLLDHHLESLVEPAVAKLRVDIDFWGQTHTPVSVQTHLLFKYIYLLTKTRGYKTIVKFMSHNVDDLEPVFEFLSSLDSKDNGSWETRYVCFVWLSLICMIPFDLKRVDSGAGQKSQDSLIVKMLVICKGYLKVTGKERDGASLLIARLLSRRDLCDEHLIPFIQWCEQRLGSNIDVFETTGILSSLCDTYQLSPREVLWPTLDDHIIPILSLPFFTTYADNSLIRKMRTKLTQRVGLCYLKPKIAAWRYQRGNRSLRQNLEASESKGPQTNAAHSHAKEDEIEDEEEISENLEIIFDILLTGLRDKDTIVRWSAAKGIGRITQRLPRELAEDVIGSILELFEENTYIDPKTQKIDMTAVSENTWHGASLAVAELARRGLLLPERLKETVPWIGLKFDLKRGSHSIGSHVRDAACYVCWSFARAYAPAILEPFVENIAQSLVVVSVFDREINIRRASSAAFQENVGRQGIFPRGIDIIQTADYFSVGNRTNAFLSVAISIAKFDDYRYHLIDHLVNITAKHWDKAMRVLASKALYELTALDPMYMIDKAIPTLIPFCIVSDLQISHGAMLSLAEICLALGECRKKDAKIEEYWQTKKEMLKSIGTIVPLLPPRSLTTFGSEHIREAACHLIECLSLADFPPLPNTLVSWKSMILSSLKRKEENVQEYAVAGFGAMFQQYGITQKDIDMFLESILITSVIHARRGFALALGTIEYNTDQRLVWLHTVIEQLCLATRKQRDEQYANDAASKRNAVIGLTNILKGLGDQLKKLISLEEFKLILFTLETCLTDYSIDQRGDVGSWVRVASMECLHYLIPCVAGLDTADSKYLSKDDIGRVISALLKQGVERIDRVRASAGAVVNDFIDPVSKDSPQSTMEIPGRQVLQKHITRDLSWASASTLYPIMVHILSLPMYRFELLTGLISSAGGLTESLVRHSSACLIEYMNSLPIEKDGQNDGATLQDISMTLLAIFAKNEKYDRITIPLLDVIGLLYESGTLPKLADETIHSKILAYTRRETFRCKNIKKLVSAIKVYLGLVLLQNTVVKTKALQQLLSYLVHAFPRIRTEAADQLYTFISLLDPDEITDGIQEAEEIITTTDWSGPVTEIKPVRDGLYGLFDIPKPVIKTT
ncbi:tubulin folding cofactor D C terminal-domain-containing protein [Phycomyces nitens]|nr:tubulin folding cofactor D C terminal-domain-containing protein [Phycomyces nitens]